ncbi:MAG: O-acetylhomoserine aminocarboxypropyltransferase/cysteine synthase family protein [Solibacillus sp.]
MTKYHFDTVAVHGGHELDNTKSRAVPIYQTTSYVFESSAHAADLFSLEQDGHIYSRMSNPTIDVLEKRIAELEGGTAAVATASGQAAITLTLLTLAKPGDEIISSVNIYGGTYNLFANTLKRAGINVIFVPADNPAAFEEHINEKTKAIFAETVGNPSLHVLDIEALADVAHRHNLPLVIDSTFTPPYITRPIEHGADIVVHSATKWLGGHGTSVAGVIVESGKFNWASGRFPEFVEPEPSFQGVKFYERFGEQTFTARVRNLLLRDYGPSLSPMSAFLILLGLETLHLRMERHNENAAKLADYLNQHPAVDWVLYPGLESHPSHANAKKYMKNGYGSMVVFGLKGSRADAARVLDETKLWSHLANVGDAKSLIIHPASTTHQQLDAESLLKTGVTETLIRLSVGIESFEDIKNDLAQAIEKAVAVQV